MYLAYEGVTHGGYTDGIVAGALDEFELVYSYLYSRVGNRADAEDLAQQVALKALPRLREGSTPAAVRGYLFATARSVLSGFWANRYRLPESELVADVADDDRGRALEAPARAAAWLDQTLAALPPHYREVLELRFLRGCSLSEVASEMGKSVGAVKVMQLRALRAAAAVGPAPPASPTAPRSGTGRAEPPRVRGRV
jgi:RNA polymerase sigma factor (sigma-70 family)